MDTTASVGNDDLSQPVTFGVEPLMEGCGHATQFVCRFHGWRWNHAGENTHVVERADWGDALEPERIRLRQVRIDTWGGWVWINMEEANTIIRPGKGKDVRVSTAELQTEVMETVNASTTDTLVRAAARLVNELAEDTPPQQVMAHFMESAGPSAEPIS